MAEAAPLPEGTLVLIAGAGRLWLGGLTLGAVVGAIGARGRR